MALLLNALHNHSPMQGNNNCTSTSKCAANHAIVSNIASARATKTENDINDSISVI